ncbi:MAG: HAMP domain-containing histidine kinase, partial [Thermoproteota archaeon]|nr:HAMP domain-containing histidine kinase [Thermoproteota archaeon]
MARGSRTHVKKKRYAAMKTKKQKKYERTEMLMGPEITTKQAWEFFSNVNKKFDGCASSAATPIVITVFRNAYENMKARGIKIRAVTDITRDNLNYCKDLMRYAEVRHISHLIGNFGVSETEYIVAPTMKEGQPMPKLIFSNSKEMVEQQQNIFDIFWSKSIPAEERIKEIEEDRQEEFLEIINNPEKATEVYVNLAKSVESSALLLLPNSKALIRDKKLGVLDHLLQASKNKLAQDIRIICSIDDNNIEIVKRLHEDAPNIKILNTTTNLATKLFIINSDRLFRAELRDPQADTFSNAFGLAIYSNSKPTVDSVKSLFELVWQSQETNEKLHEADKVKKEFINIAAHELRTPIVPILNLSELLYSKISELPQQLDDQEGREMLEMLEIILRNANRLHQLTEDILDVTRIESHTLKLRKERFNLNDAILSVVEDYGKHTAASNSNVKVIYETANSGSGNIQVEADRRRLMQVISNLLDNAIKFTKEGTVTVTTSIRRRRGGGKDIESDRRRGGEEEEGEEEGKGSAEEVVIAVKDTGTGIDPELMPR